MIMTIPEEEKASFDGLITSLIPVGGLLGACYSNVMLKTQTRRTALIFTDIVGIVGKVGSL